MSVGRYKQIGFSFKSPGIFKPGFLLSKSVRRQKCHQGLNKFPPDSVIHILKFMSVEERIKFSKTSRQNHQLVIDSFREETIDLSEKPINDADLELFKYCKEINLEGCDQITDAGLAYLTNATSVNLSGCDQITDAGLALLTNATYVILIGCDQITDAGLEHLTKAESVDLRGCCRITDAAKQRLRARGVEVVA